MNSQLNIADQPVSKFVWLLCCLSVLGVWLIMPTASQAQRHIYLNDDTKTILVNPAPAVDVGQRQSSFSCSVVSQISSKECQALVSLYEATNGKSWTDNATNGWLNSARPCEWAGVTCQNNDDDRSNNDDDDDDGGTITGKANNVVIKVVRNNKNLSGNLPRTLSNLSQLTELSLASNKLSGPIPSELGTLSRLTKLSLASNELSGAIPVKLGSLSQLTELSLASNKLSGAIPSELGSLTTLNVFDLGDNQLSGEIPVTLSQLKQLDTLRLDENKLTGTLLPEFGKLTGLKELSLQDNIFSGAIPTTWGNLNNLTSLTLDNNADLSGPLPQNLRQISGLKTFKFSDTELCEPTDTAFQTWLGRIPDLSSTKIKCLPKLTISKSGPQSVNGGDPITYRLTIKNSGLITATALQITDTIPAGATVIGANGGVTVPAKNVVTWQVASLPVGSSAEVSFTVMAKQNIVNRDYRVVSQSGVSSTGRVAVSTTVLSAPVVTITKSAPMTALQGESYVYRLVITNTGTADVTAVNVYDRLPNGVIYQKSTKVLSKNSTFDGQFVRWSNLSLAAGQSMAVTYTVKAQTVGLTINDDYGVQLNNQTAVTGNLEILTYIESKTQPAVEFGPPQRFGSRNSRSIALADLDGDGDLDMLVGNASPNEVWLNNGSGVFTQSMTIGGGDSEGVALGDLNGDGRPDAIIANSNNQTNTVWLNNGSGVFTQSVSLGGGDSQAIALGDLNGDGSLDTVIVNSSNQTNTVWLNNGSGVFTQSVGLGGGDSQGVALGDLNGDNTVDLVVVNGNSQTNTVWLNNGSGVFTQSVGLGGGDSQGVALGDLNGDGSLDVVIGNQNNQPNQVWLNNGTGVFTQSQSLGNSDSQAVSLGDLNGDGRLDIFVGNGSNQPNEVWLNNGDGTFTNNGQALQSGNSNAVVLGDLNQDCVPDAIVAEQSSSTQTGSNQILINQAKPACSNNYLPIILK